MVCKIAVEPMKARVLQINTDAASKCGQQQTLNHIVDDSGGSSPGPGHWGHAPPRWLSGNFFASILIVLLSRLNTIGRGNTKVAVCRSLLLSNRLVFAAFYCLCAVHCMQAAAESFVSPKAVFLACIIGS